ncbi:hypothetical protein SAMCCGM7_pA0287 (plasmid) [Sinorhizobium americanum CCGM7]|nr:hypothetical protein SAMCCGM7_pA0287 [Sinorhizobium americanum CCGM7]
MTPSEIDMALKVKVKEVNVFGEPPIDATAGTTTSRTKGNA